MRGVLYISVIVIIALAGTSSAQPFQSVEQPVLGGTVHDGDPSTVAIITIEGGLCTGTLISPYVVLTAAHCVMSQQTYAFIGNDLNVVDGGQFIPIYDYVAHDGYSSSTPVVDIEHDIALMFLGERAPSRLTPRPVQIEPLTQDLRDEEIRLVGYGLDPDDPGVIGVKKQGWASFVDFDHDAVLYLSDPNMNCGGDSGGPLFMTIDGEEHIVAVVSIGDGLCLSHGRGTRVDSHYEGFIQPELERTVQRDQRTGGRCSDPWDCSSGICIPALDFDEFSFCVSHCESDADCPGDMTCIVNDHGGAYCQHFPNSPGVLGDACDENVDCLFGFCGGWTTDSAICTYECDPTTPCMGFEECVRNALNPAQHVCLVAPREPPPEEGCCVVGRRHRASWPAVVLCILVFAHTVGRKRRW